MVKCCTYWPESGYPSVLYVVSTGLILDAYLMFNAVSTRLILDTYLWFYVVSTGMILDAYL